MLITNHPKIKFLKSVIVLAVLTTVFLPWVVLAQEDKKLTDDQIEEINARCWTQEACEGVNGIWGSGDDYKKLNNDNIDQWGNENCPKPGTSDSIFKLLKPTARCFSGNPDISLQIGIPGISGDKFCGPIPLGKIAEQSPYVDCTSDSKKCGSDLKCMSTIKGGFPGYLQKFYTFFVSALALVAVVMIMWGGFKRIMAMGNQEQITSANETISGSLIGLIIALGAYTVLNLINPRLVQNTLPLIEKTKPQAFGSCPVYSGSNKSLYDTGYKIISSQCANTSGGKRDGWPCEENSDCEHNGVPGKCIGPGLDAKKPNGSNVGNTCGISLELNGKQCVGTECLQGGCYPVKMAGERFERKACGSYAVAGNISGIEINTIDLLAICNDGAEKVDCWLNVPNSYDTVREINAEDGGYYTIGGCAETVSSIDNLCGGSDLANLKGFALVLERESDGNDDWYAVDASSCQSPVTKRIDEAGSTTLTTNNLDFTNVPDNKLFSKNALGLKTKTRSSPLGDVKFMEATKPVNCNLNITGGEFPDR